MCSSPSHVNGRSHHDLISGGTHCSYERMEYAFMRLLEYTIISLQTRKKYFVSNYTTSKSNK